MKNSISSRSQTQAGTNACGHEQAPWNFLSELSRQQLAMATESASAIFRGNEILRKIQQETAHEASIRHAKAAQKLFSHCEPAELLSIQSELLRTDLQTASHYWEQLAKATLQAQREMMASMSHLLDSESGSGMNSAMQALQAAIPAMTMANNFLTPKSHSANSANGRFSSKKATAPPPTKKARAQSF